jgi:hypothetical protein
MEQMVLKVKKSLTTKLLLINKLNKNCVAISHKWTFKIIINSVLKLMTLLAKFRKKIYSFMRGLHTKLTYI